MDYLIVQLIQKHFRNILFWILLCISPVVLTTISGQNLNAERDSLINEVRKYPADTARFLIFLNFFWQYANTGTKVTISIPVLEYVIKHFSEYKIDIPNTGIRPERNCFDATEFIKEDKNENTVLLVEDNDELRAFIADLLKAEFNVRVAKDGQEGLHAAFNNIPDIIISDVMMPGMDGFELCAILKKDERRPE